MTDTPICDFVRAYAEGHPARMHMPGHKGKAFLGPEALDLTEIEGADVLYRSRGIIRRSEENGAALFGAARTVYSAEGSSLCIRAMLYLAAMTAAEQGRPRRLLAGRNAHRTLMTAAALLDLEIDWLMPAEGDGLLSCTATAAELEARLAEEKYMAVFLTSPDYAGRRADLRGAAEACRRHGVPLLTDNAHGAYLRFLEPDEHPMTLGVDACCDSAHKTLPCLTGAAYLHLSGRAPKGWAEQAEQAMAMFASTSPSYLILQSLDRANRELAGDWPRRLRLAAARTEAIKKKLRAMGWEPIGNEPMKLTLNTAKAGYTGNEVAERLHRAGIYEEYADRDCLVLMPSAETGAEDFGRLEAALEAIPFRAPLRTALPAFPAPERVCSIREAMLAPGEEIPTEQAIGRVLADACVSCPPAVSPVIAGERITEAAAAWMRYYGITACRVVRRGSAPGAE